LKTCSKCSEEKPYEDFYLRAKSRDGYHQQCIACLKAWHREFYRKRSAVIRARSGAWYRNNTERAHEYGRYYKRAKPEVIKQIQDRHRARKTQAEVTDFTEAQWRELLTVNGVACAYCGRSDREICRDHDVPLALGGDHTLTNIIPACRVCNSRKHTKTALQFIIENANA
jgi:5-methylcytosine-specific restriction endonuclease McrA